MWFFRSCATVNPMSPARPHLRRPLRALVAALALCWVGCAPEEDRPVADTDLPPDDPFCAGNTWHPDLDLDGFGDREVFETGCTAQDPSWIRQGGDCDDTTAAVAPGLAELPNGIDDDCNDIADDGTPLFDDDGDGYCESEVGPCTDGSSPGDCDDADLGRHPTADEGCDGIDTNCDGVIAGRERDQDQDGFIACAECNDSDDAVYPGAEESCTGADTNCDGFVDNQDADADGAMDCPASGGSLDLLVVLDNSVRMLSPQDLLAGQSGALFDQLEQQGRDYRIGILTTDAPTLVVPAITPRSSDARGTFKAAVRVGTQGSDSERPVGQIVAFLDSADGLAWRRPGAPLAILILSNEDDQSWIDLETLEATVVADLTPASWRVSTISGGWRGCSANGRRGEPAPRLEALAARTGGQTGNICQEGWIAGWGPAWMPDSATDCDATDPAVHPHALERVNGVDDDCDTLADVAEDDDGDGYTVQDGDCDDSRGHIHPQAAELCNGIDDDCDGLVPDAERDRDGDRWRTCAGDCDDLDNQRHPHAIEDCGDGIDSNCNGTDGGLLDTVDDDADGYTACAGDCDDADDSIFPWAPEHAFDTLDNDCDGRVDGRDVDATVGHPTLGADSLLALHGSSRLFSFCGQPVQDLLVAANGYILPGTSPYFDPSPGINGLRNHAPMIAAGWADLDPTMWNGGGRFLTDYGQRAPLYVVQRSDGLSVIWDGVPYQEGTGVFTGVTTLTVQGDVEINVLEGSQVRPTLVGYACDSSVELALDAGDLPMCAAPASEPVAAAFVHGAGYPARLSGDCTP